MRTSKSSAPSTEATTTKSVFGALHHLAWLAWSSNGKGTVWPLMEVFHDIATGVTCRMWSHSVSCYLTQVNTPALTPAIQAGTRFTYPGGMEGWADLVDLIAPRPGVEPATFRSRVRRPTTAPPRQIKLARRRRYSGEEISIFRFV